ncbi:MAG TPA: hypothetical protein VGW35_15520 [Methylomirabilota bacterium]|jgi:hypothetical protein|nr:hypothetical protein [Methylomirabilota bacterium]
MMDRSIKVLAYAGSRAEERPRGVWRGTEAIAVTDVLWAWLESAVDPAAGRRRWFRVRLATAEELTLYHDEALDAWFTPEAEGPTAPAGGGPA